ncbi:MAG: type II secretion system protein GspN [Deltaproteobacteria bacterium]|nr:type II secretion system protein GspN [Deltaproteobacteria bacterium]
MLKKWRRILIIGGYVIFAGFSLLLALSYTFPADVVSQRLENEVQKITNGQYAIQFNNVSTYRFSGIHAKTAIIRSTQPGNQPLKMQLNDFHIRVQLLPLILFRLAIASGFDIEQGELDFQVEMQNSGAMDINMDVDDLSISSPPILLQQFGLPVIGYLNLRTDIKWRPFDVKQTKGVLNLKLDKVAIGPGKVSGLTVPTTTIGTIKLNLTANDGIIKVASFQQEGGQVQINLDGNIKLKTKFNLSNLDLCIKIKPDQSYLNKNPNIATAWELSAAKFRKDPKGFLHIPYGGTINRPIKGTGLCKVTKDL